MSTKLGHCLGKSQWRIFWRATTSWARVFGWAAAMMGTRRARTRAFSCSEMAFWAWLSSGLVQPLDMRFLKYTTPVQHGSQLSCLPR
jgi:hypothetical protein